MALLEPKKEIKSSKSPNSNKAKINQSEVQAFKLYKIGEMKPNQGEEEHLEPHIDNFFNFSQQFESNEIDSTDEESKHKPR